MYKKIAIVAAFAATALVFSGCGNKTPVNNDKSSAGPSPSASSSVSPSDSSSVSAENLPVPTGKVDDTVNAIVDGANKEGNQAISDDNDAKSATASNSQAVDEVGQGL